MTGTPALAERLYDEVLVPLVLGGAVKPSRFVAGKRALELGDHLPLDLGRFSDLQAQRLVVARRLVAIDNIPPPTASDYAFLACIHDLLLSLHPSMRGATRTGLLARVFSIVSETAKRTPMPQTLREAVARHTLVSRLFEMERCDTTVDFWTGSRTFEGSLPPARLVAWPKLRRVRLGKKRRPFAELVRAAAASARYARLVSTLADVLARSPLTYFMAAGDLPSFRVPSELAPWLARREMQKVLLRALRRDPRADERIDAYATSEPPGRLGQEVLAFLIAWGVDARGFLGREPFPRARERTTRDAYAPVVAAFERALTSSSA